MVFYTGNALQVVLADDLILRKQFLENYKENQNNSINDLCDHVPTLREKLNVEISKSFMPNQPHVPYSSTNPLNHQFDP